MTSSDEKQQLRYDRLAADILACLERQRQSASRLCDVIIRSPDAAAASDPLAAHGCVLATSSDYFQTLFTCPLDARVPAAAAIPGDDVTGRRVIDIPLPNMTREIVKKVIDFMYTGSIALTPDVVPEVLRLADFLRMPRLLELCAEYLRRTIDPSNCLHVRQLVEMYHLSVVSPSLATVVMTTVSAQLPAIFSVLDAADAPPQLVAALLADPCRAAVHDRDVFLALCRCAASAAAAGQPSTSAAYLDLLHDAVDFDRLSAGFLRRRVLANPAVVDWLGRRQPHILDAVSSIAAADTPEDVVGTGCRRRQIADAVVCRSRAPKAGDDVELVVYVVDDDDWWMIRPPTNDDGCSLAGLESMIVDGCFLYALCTTRPDLLSYVSPVPTETKHFLRLDLRTGDWQPLPGPSTVDVGCRLAAAGDGIYVVDRAGRVELFSTSDARWAVRCSDGFPPHGCGPTLYVLPMPLGDGRLMALRSFSSGYCFRHTSASVSLHRLDVEQRAWTTLQRSEIETHDLAPSGDARGDVCFHGYAVGPGVVSLLDEFGVVRAEYDLTIGDWRPPSSASTPVVRPPFVGAVLGSASHGGRVYCVFTGLDRRCAGLVAYDWSRRRFKAVRPAPVDLSGLVCHVTLPRSALVRLGSRPARMDDEGDED